MLLNVFNRKKYSSGSIILWFEYIYTCPFLLFFSRVESNPTSFASLQTLLSEFNKEQEAFIKAKGGKGGEALPPWVGYPDEEGLKEEILALSTVSTRLSSSP